MTPEQQRIAIAEACGLAHIEVQNGQLVGVSPKSFTVYAVPDYLNDLNAMHEAERLMVMDESSITYLKWLNRLSCPWCATATQRAEAFLKTLNLWKP